MIVSKPKPQEKTARKRQESKRRKEVNYVLPLLTGTASLLPSEACAPVPVDVKAHILCVPSFQYCVHMCCLPAYMQGEIES